MLFVHHPSYTQTALPRLIRISTYYGAVITHDTRAQISGAQIPSIQADDAPLIASYTLDCAATPRCFRLIHCQAWLQHRALVVYEYSGDPRPDRLLPYSAIYHLWDSGVPTRRTSGTHCFQVSGLAPPYSPHPGLHRTVRISWDVLHYVCETSQREGCPYVWLDALCLMLDEPVDVAWYTRSCLRRLIGHAKAVIVLPAGLEHLVDILRGPPSSDSHSGARTERPAVIPWSQLAGMRDALSLVTPKTPVLVIHKWSAIPGAGRWTSTRDSDYGAEVVEDSDAAPWVCACVCTSPRSDAAAGRRAPSRPYVFGKVVPV